MRLRRDKSGDKKKFSVAVWNHWLQFGTPKYDGVKNGIPGKYTSPSTSSSGR